MNAERLRVVAGAIQNERAAGKSLPKFDMKNWAVLPTGYNTNDPELVTDCGTTCCIAGMACFLYKDEAKNHRYIEEAAAKILGLSYSQADNLFIGKFANGKELSAITREEAVAELHRLADHADKG